MNVPIDITDVMLTTPRLILRPWRQSDLADFYEYASVDGVGQMAGWPPHESIEDSQRVLDSFIEHKKVFAIEYEGKVIGSLGVEEYDEEIFPQLKDLKARELGFVLSKDYWGRGLMPEAAKEVIRWLFEDVGLDAITCCHYAQNIQSARVQEKCGFKFFSRYQRENRYGLSRDTVANVLMKEDWI